MENVLTFDIGGTNLKYGIVSENGIFIKEGIEKSPKTYEGLLVLMTKIIFENENQINKKIGVSCPANYIENKIVGSSFLEYLTGKDIVGDIEKKTGYKVNIENDGNCSILGEYIFSPDDNQNIAAIVIGSGIGGGIIINGELIKGKNFLAGEFGFCLLSEEAFRGDKKNVFGTIAGVNGFIDAARKINGEIRTGEDIFNNAMQLSEVIISECRLVAMQAINLQYILDLDQIYIGGGISNNSAYIEEINNQILKYGVQLPYHYVLPKVKALTNKNKSNLLGATQKCWEK